MDSLPELSADLIDALDALYPERCPTPNMSDRDIWIAVGQREVVRHLLGLLYEGPGSQTCGPLEQFSHHP